MRGLLEGKTALITGCNRGIGKAVLQQFAENGASIVACSRSQKPDFLDYCEMLEKKYAVSIWSKTLNLKDRDNMKEIVQFIKNHCILDVLVNNAGISHSALFPMTTRGQAEELMNVNYLGTMEFSQYMLKVMSRVEGGSIINLVSSAAYACDPGQTAYAASKAAVVAMTKVLAKECAKFNIRVNAVAPGPVKTRMMDEMIPEKEIVKILDRSCMKRPGEPEEIAKVILFLASDLSSFMTGEVLHVDGGMNIVG